MDKLETFRLTFNIPTDLLGQVDEYAKKMCVNRTSALCFLLSQSLNSQKAMNDIGELLKLYQEEQAKTSKAE
jgi:metal-responsive CopG/Arc/MetJ family transcriptional regulator